VRRGEQGVTSRYGGGDAHTDTPSVPSGLFLPPPRGVGKAFMNVMSMSSHYNIYSRVSVSIREHSSR